MQTISQLPPLRPDTLRWAISLALLASTPTLAQPALTPARGPGGTPLIGSGHGVPVIDIVAPNASGLSHNQFLDYNVGKPGVVLNNATQAGQSQLAGALQANSQFQGQAASTILNEVISRNTSLIEGPQEIFGRRADYILANPNGITINGGSFINTTRAGLLVGSPELQDARLNHLSTLDAQGSLHVLGGGGSNAEGALDLIAPRIDSKGLLQAKSDLNLTLGRNRIDYATGEVLQHLPGTPSNIDANLFGAMRAGRIRVVSTAEGAGVRVGPVKVWADQGIAIHSAGALEIAGEADLPSQLHSERGDLKLTAADDLDMRAAKGHAERIEIKAGNKLTLDAKTAESIAKDQKRWNKKFWFVTHETYERKRTTTDRQQQGTELRATDSIRLESGADMRLAAADIRAGGKLAVDSGANLDIVAGIDSQRIEEQVRHRKHLWRGDTDTDQYRESARASTLDGGHLNVTAKERLKVAGSNLHSRGDLDIAAKKVEVGTTALEQHGTRRNYRGDLVSGAFFGDRKGNDTQGRAVTGSNITADGKLQVTAEQVDIKGSRVHGEQDALLYGSKGSLVIEADHGNLTSSDHQRNSKLFGLFANNDDSTTRSQQVLRSDVGSSTNLRLASAEELRIQGAKVEAGGHLQVAAKGDVLIDGAQAINERETRSQQRGFSASVGQTQEAQDGKPGSRQYTASVGYDVSTRTSSQRQVTHEGSQLKGASVALSSDAHLQVNGARVEASAGDLDVQAKQVTLGARRNETQSSTEQTRSGGGLTLTGGIDRLGSLFEGHHQIDSTVERDSTVQRSELRASGDLRLKADELVSEAARVNAGGTLEVAAKHIDNRAVEDIHEREKRQEKWAGSLGASLEYRDLTRPIERLVQGEEAARFQQASPEDAMVAPSVGGDMTVEHLKRLENQRRGFAQVSELSGAQVAVKAERIDDEGTAWRADAGKLQIDAQQHHMRAAHNTQAHEVQHLAYGGDLRVDTSTGQDLNVRVAGKGGSLATQEQASTAVPGSLQGKSGIQVQLGSDGRYEGTRIDGGEGGVVMQSGGNLSLLQATDKASQTSGKLDGNAWAKVGNRPGSTGVDGRGYLDHGQRQASQTKAQVAQIDARGEVRLGSGGDLLLEGTRIGKREAKVADLHLKSDGLLTIKAASDTQQASGSGLGGGLELGLKTGGTKGGAVGGHFNHGRQDEEARQAIDAQFASASKLSLDSRAREDLALHLQGLQASAEQIELYASNGGMLIEASSNQERRDNLDITAGAGFNQSKGATDTRGIHGRVQVNLDQRNNHTWNADTLRADHIDVQSLGDTRLEGVSLEAGQITGNIGGDLRVASRKDSIDSLSVKVDARLSHEKNPQGYTNAARAVAGPFGGKVGEKAGPTLSKVEPGLSPTFKLEMSKQQRDTVAHQATLKGSAGIDLNVAGEAHLVGARMQSAKGEVALDAASVTRETLSGTDWRRDLSIDASNSPVDLGTAIADMAKGKGAADGDNALDLGLLRTSGHNRSEQWSSHIQGKAD
ncbi:filamentous hemagglutinin N-terminal domain-containing protein [Pseudomonas putida]|uniref:Filamentous hemagglutinin N-terminal domain-containing protein n=1 Tax=Pseudomonas putida TaxID=303 RepID=A0A4D6XB73_PSEPU|nr:hemagglutinin repeat-containing protein [Pseudomonas putida]QCI14376.1 filamentous hemagglutinin N-terminal domain-containing protein [Pseudomonas putida]